ncbi:mucin-13 [Spea bombifrons]|uniref:mucin-13 n=1 Tax=Spea bombifrons TaxID=233779 RepID=UPI00234AE1C2|nr:mucin-13 [Spea bombifrons]
MGGSKLLRVLSTLSLLILMRATTIATETTTTTNPANTETTTTTNPANTETTTTTNPANTETTTTTNPANTETTTTTNPANTETTTTTNPANTETTTTTNPANTDTTTTTNPANTETTTTTSPANTETTTTTNPANTETTTTTNPANTETTITTNPANTETTITTNPANTETTITTNPANTETTTTTNPANTETTTTTNPANTETTITTNPANTTETQGSTTPGANGTEDTSTTTATPTSPTTPAAITACNADSCGIATCVGLHETFRCRCPVYLYYINGSCTAGDSVFGNLVLNNQAFSQGNLDEYTQIYKEVERHFQRIFANDTGYAQTVIQDISAQTSRSRTARNGVTVSVRTIVMFQLNSIDPEEVVNITTQYFKDEGIGSFAEQSVCDGFYCEMETTTCTVTAAAQPPVCKCREGFYTSAETITSCRECDPSCGSVEGQHCVLDSEKRLPKCVCGPGYKTTRDNKCTKCPFGYTGEGCKDNFKLLLVIIGSVAGALLIALFGTIIGCSIRSRKRGKSSDRNHLLLHVGYSGSSSSPQPERLFPKVTAKADLGQVNKSANMYEDDEQFTRSMPKRDYEEDPWYEMSHRDRKY